MATLGFVTLALAQIVRVTAADLFQVIALIIQFELFYRNFNPRHHLQTRMSLVD